MASPAKILLTDQPVVDEVEGKLCHALSGGALGVDLRRPLEPGSFKVVMATTAFTMPIS